MCTKKCQKLMKKIHKIDGGQTNCLMFRNLKILVGGFYAAKFYRYIRSYKFAQKCLCQLLW